MKGMKGCRSFTAAYQLYEKFSIKCYGYEGLLQALEPDTRIQDADTFRWFSTLADIHSPVFSGFDIMDPKWVALANTVTPEQYRHMFAACLDDGMTKEEIQRRLDRYQELTGKSYIDFYWNFPYKARFGLLVDKGVLDLWDLFQGSLGEDGGIEKRAMADHVWHYARGIRTPQAYRFWEQFFTAYDIEGLERFFGNRHRDFFDDLTEREGHYYGQDTLRLKLHRDFLDGEGHRLLLRWLEMYIFTYKPEKYMELVTAILRDEAVAGLFSAGEQREFFDLVAKQPGTHQGILSELKRRYLTEAEQQAERDAEAAARRASELRQREEMVQGIRDKYAELLDGTFASVVKFLDEYR